MFQTDMEAIKAGRNSTLARHNAKRALHRGTNPMQVCDIWLIISDYLIFQLNQRASEKAQEWADKIACGEAFGFDPDNKYESYSLFHNLCRKPESGSEKYLIKRSAVAFKEIWRVTE